MQKKSSPLGLVFVAGIVGAILVLIGIAYAVVSAQVQKLNESAFIVGAADVFGMPVASINGRDVDYAAYVRNKETLRFIYDQSPEGSYLPTDEEVSDMAVSQLLAEELIRDLAKERDIRVSKEDIEAKQQELFAIFESPEAVEEEIARVYNISLDEYTKRVIVPLVYDEKLRAAILAERGSDQSDSRSLAETVLSRAKAGEDFAALAAEFGTDSTNQSGGDLGWFTRGVMVEPFENAAFALEVGQISDLVESEFGYHIIEVTEKRTTSTPQGDEEEIRARHILIRDTTDEEIFNQFMQEQITTANFEFHVPIHNPFEGLADLQQPAY